MVTEPAADSELSVTLPPSLSEWLDERADALDIGREALLVQLLETHRSTAEMDDDGLASLFESVDTAGPDVVSTIDDLDDRVDGIDDRIDEVDDRVDGVDSRVDGVEAELAKNVEDIRNRVLQLRDAVEERAPADHSHEETEALADRLEAVSAEIDEVTDQTDDVSENLWWLSTEISTTEDRLETLESKINRLAKVAVDDRRRGTANAAATAELNELRRAANRAQTTTADCANCENPVQIGLLSEAACPHCDRRLHGLETPDSVFRWFKAPVLTVGDDTDEETGTSDE